MTWKSDLIYRSNKMGSQQSSTQQRRVIHKYKGGVFHFQHDSTVYLSAWSFTYVRSKKNPKGYLIMPFGLPDDVHEKNHENVRT